MSHAKILGKAMAKIDSKYVIRNITGPGVPPGWSFAAYREDKDRHEASVVILGIMTDSIAYISATSGATSFFDSGHPYTFPRYSVVNGELKDIYPPFYTEKGFKNYLFNPIKWAKYRDWLSKHDKYYSPILFKKTIADKSAMLRVLRRGYSVYFNKKRIGNVYTNNGFNCNSEEMIALRKILITFAQEVKMQKRIPIVYIVNNEGHGDHLYRALKPVLDTYKIAYLSTHIICPPDNPRVFNGMNSHFIPSKDTELAREMIKIIEGLKGEEKRDTRHNKGGLAPIIATGSTK